VLFVRRNPGVSKVAVVVLLASTLGCAHVETERGCARFGAARYCLQPPVTAFNVTQSVEAIHRGGAQRLAVYVDVGVREMTVVGLTPFGRRLFFLRFGESGLDASSQISSAVGLSAEELLGGLQLAFWPLSSARGGVRGAAARLEELSDGTRQLQVGDDTVFTATCEGTRPKCRRARISYPTLGQTLSIETVEGRSS